MYSGNLIDDLIATVERAETSSRAEIGQESSEIWHPMAELIALEAAPQLAGVA
jgi:hypothetical protein